jgi:hypothetical protein
MLYGIGLTEEDLKKAQVGIVSMGYDGNVIRLMIWLKILRLASGRRFSLIFNILVSVTVFQMVMMECVFLWFLVM